MTTIVVHKNEPIEKALRRLKKIVTKEGVIQTLKNHRYYEKPSDRRRRKRSQSRRSVTQEP